MMFRGSVFLPDMVYVAGKAKAVSHGW